MVRETTDPGLHAVVSFPPQRSWAREWGPVLTLIVTLLGGGALVFRVIAWPWETKADAAAVHGKLQGGIDDLREEQRTRDAAASQKLDRILERLPEPRKAKRP
jgi:hypothetical protein